MVLAAALSRVAAAQPPERPSDETPQNGRETGLFPLAGGDTDNGFGAGVLGSLAEFDGHSVPFRWQLQFATFIATKSDVTSPSYEDVYFNLILPNLLHRRLRLEIRPAFTRETALRFYGLGNAVHVPDAGIDSRDFYTRVHPQLDVRSRWRLTGDWSLIAGASYLHNETSFDPTSTLAMQVPMIDPSAARGHAVVRGIIGAAYDTRDNELAPNEGIYHSVTLTGSPHLGDAVPYGYEQANVTLRFYTTVLPHRTVLATRVVGDIQHGDVPFYELSRYDNTSAIGGGLGIRGVPGYTFYGKLKLFGNVELRTHVTSFDVADRQFRLGVVTFFDAGRLWTDASRSHPELDGRGLGLHWGTGIGVRLQQGRAFMVRGDLAWSPDARPIAGYVTADHMF